MVKQVIEKLLEHNKKNCPHNWEIGIICDAKTENEVYKKLGNNNFIEWNELEINVLEKDNYVLLHNHPSGMSLSDSDIIFSIAHKITQIVAIGYQRVYVFTPNPKLELTPELIGLICNKVKNNQHKKLAEKLESDYKDYFVKED